MFNTLRYAKKLEEVGVSREQAEVHIQIMTEVMESNLATKNDLRDVRNEIKDVRGEIKDLKSEIKELEYRLIIKLGATMGVMIGISFAGLASLIRMK